MFRSAPRIGLLFLAALLLAAVGLAVRARRSPMVVRVDLAMVPGPWAGLTDEEVRGLRLVVADHLETLGGLTVSDGGGEPLSKGSLRLTLSGERSPLGLALQARMEGPDQAPREHRIPAGDPTAAIHQVLRTLLPRKVPDRDALDPTASDAFWPLCRALEAPYTAEGTTLPARLEEAEGLAAKEPRSLAQLARAHLRYRVLLDDSSTGQSDTGSCEQGFQQALSALAGCPRLVQLHSNFRTDVGDQRMALDLLFQATRERPHVAGLYDSMAYAARTLGLLDGAKIAIRKRDELGGRVGQAYFLAENTLLYTGEWEAFEQSLEGGHPEPVTDFYRGYARLLREAPAEALPYFRRGAAHQAGIKVFRRLCDIYRLALEGHPEEALRELRALDDSRVSVKVPDGEFTFKLAEAYAFLGRRPEAFDLARRAFGQGFLCADWYARSPFLAPLRGEPQWEAFLAGLKDRQRRLEERFPADRFEK